MSPGKGGGGYFFHWEVGRFDFLGQFHYSPLANQVLGGIRDLTCHEGGMGGGSFFVLGGMVINLDSLRDLPFIETFRPLVAPLLCSGPWGLQVSKSGRSLTIIQCCSVLIFNFPTSNIIPARQLCFVMGLMP